jgi:hypothetical protein
MRLCVVRASQRFSVQFRNYDSYADCEKTSRHVQTETSGLFVGFWQESNQPNSALVSKQREDGEF